MDSEFSQKLLCSTQTSHVLLPVSSQEVLTLSCQAWQLLWQRGRQAGGVADGHQWPLQVRHALFEAILSQVLSLPSAGCQGQQRACQLHHLSVLKNVYMHIL